MFATLLTFIISSFVAIFMILNKMGQISGSKLYLTIHSHEFERRVINRLASIWDWIYHSAGRGIRAFSLKALETSEQFFVKTFFKIFRYISKLTDMVRGHDIPKNKGSASFFLKRIEDSKKKVL